MTISTQTAPPAAAIVASGGATKPGAPCPRLTPDEAGTPANASTPSARPRSGGVEALYAVRCLSPLSPAATPSSALSLGIESAGEAPSSWSLSLPTGTITTALSVSACWTPHGTEGAQTTGRVPLGGRACPVPTSILTAHGIDLVDGPCLAHGLPATVVRLAHAVSGACASGRWGCLVCGGFRGYGQCRPGVSKAGG